MTLVPELVGNWDKQEEFKKGVTFLLEYHVWGDTGIKMNYD